MPARTLVHLEDESSTTAKQLLRLVGESRKIELVPGTDNIGLLNSIEYLKHGIG